MLEFAKGYPKYSINKPQQQKTLTRQNKAWDLVIYVDILNLVCSCLVSCIFPKQLMENMRKSRDSTIIKQRVEINFFKKHQKTTDTNPTALLFCFLQKKVFFFEDIWNERVNSGNFLL